jgi:tRNA/tmRNA/rRNA uracil-C5-methylase (TrmA/RlmC/RlmD family)
MSAETKEAASHAAEIAYQFTAQAADFAAAAELHNEAALAALVAAATPTSPDISLDVACGPGSIVMAFARTLKQAHGFDATQAMLDQARALAERENAENVTWHSGNAEALPFADGVFDFRLKQRGGTETTLIVFFLAVHSPRAPVLPPPPRPPSSSHEAAARVRGPRALAAHRARGGLW